MFAYLVWQQIICYSTRYNRQHPWDLTLQGLAAALLKCLACIAFRLESQRGISKHNPSHQLDLLVRKHYNCQGFLSTISSLPRFIPCKGFMTLCPHLLKSKSIFLHTHAIAYLTLTFNPVTLKLGQLKRPNNIIDKLKYHKDPIISSWFKAQTIFLCNCIYDLNLWLGDLDLVSPSRLYQCRPYA